MSEREFDDDPRIDDDVEAEMTADSDGPTDTDALLSRLQVIADQPLASRAEALGQMHDELRRRLESGDLVRSDG